MEEREINPNDTLERTKIYAAKLAQWDGRIVEIVAIGELANGNTDHASKIDLICAFDPEPIGDSQGYVSVINLLLRDDHEKLSEQLGIQQPIG